MLTMTRSRKSRRESGHDAVQEILEAEIRRLRSLIENEKGAEELDDDALDAVEKTLEKIEPPRDPPSTPSAAITAEALVRTYGQRYDAGEHLWHPQDLVQQMRRRGFNVITERVVKVEVVSPQPDGTLRLYERAAIRKGDGSLEFLDRIEEEPK